VISFELFDQQSIKCPNSYNTEFKHIGLNIKSNENIIKTTKHFSIQFYVTDKNNDCCEIEYISSKVIQMIEKQYLPLETNIFNSYAENNSSKLDGIKMKTQTPQIKELHKLELNKLYTAIVRFSYIKTNKLKIKPIVVDITKIESFTSPIKPIEEVSLVKYKNKCKMNKNKNDPFIYRVAFNQKTNVILNFTVVDEELKYNTQTVNLNYIENEYIKKVKEEYGEIKTKHFLEKLRFKKNKLYTARCAFVVYYQEDGSTFVRPKIYEILNELD
jgi:hypothetical protein